MNNARKQTQFGVWLLALAVLLVGCAAPSSQDNASGKTAGKAVAAKGAEAWRNENYDEAMNLLQQAGLQGNARAQYAVGYMYYEGQGVERDIDKAVPWFRRAANQGDERAIKALKRLSQGISRQQEPATDQSQQDPRTQEQRRDPENKAADDANGTTSG